MAMQKTEEHAQALGRLYRAIELPETPDIDDESTLKSSETLFEEIEEACTAVSFVANDSSTLALSNAPALLSGYASALRRLCSAQTPALTEAEAVVGRAVAPLPAKDPRRRAASAREVEAGTAALTTWVRREMKDAHAAMGVWRFARKEGERWGARSLAWLAAVVVLDKVAELRAFFAALFLKGKSSVKIDGDAQNLSRRMRGLVRGGDRSVSCIASCL